MEKIRNGLQKVFGNKILWLALTAAGLLYCLRIMYDTNFLETVYRLWDGLAAGVMILVIALVLYIAGMGRDFLWGFYRAFSKKGKGISRMELQRMVKAFDCAEKAAVTGGIVIFILGILDVLIFTDYRSGETELFLMSFSLVMGVAFSYLLYPAIFILILLPVKARLERRIISYMEEPEDAEAEKTEADEQKLYFGLRAMGLTDREAEVARLAGIGMSNREIGQQLFIAEGTVKKHMTHILEKAGCADREALRERIKGM